VTESSSNEREEKEREQYKKEGEGMMPEKKNYVVRKTKHLIVCFV